MPKTRLKSHYRTCNLCEAMCGLKIEFSGNEIHSIKGNKQDPFSQGHICPKAVALQDLYTDKDRLRKPVKRTAEGWQEISWKQAFDEIEQNTRSIQKKYGYDAVGLYIGNPMVHNLEGMLFGPDFFRQLRTKNRFSATSVDQLPHHLAAMLMFGHPQLMPVPDVDRTDFMVIMGANPVVSNGSIMTAANIKKRLKKITQRNGKIVTIDPRFTETSKIADQHLFVTPGSDAFLLMAMLNHLFNKDLVNLNHLKDHLDGLEGLNKLFEDYTPQNVASCTGIKAEEIEQLVEDFCKAERAVFYSRIGVSTHEFGSITLWLTNLFNLLTGNLDSEGGLMLPTPAVDLIGSRKPKSKRFRRYYSRVSQYPETIGEFPVAALAEEILTPGEGQIKAMMTACGNPCLSNPNNELMKKAFSQLEFMFSIDFYINETTKYANIILPPPSPLERPHYDLAFTQLAVRNYAKYSETLFERPKGSLSEAEIYQTLTWRFSKKGLKNKIQLWLKQKTMKTLGPKGIIDKGLKRGPYGKEENEFFQNLTMSKLEQHHNGMDLGALQSCFPKRILTENGKINLAPTELVDDLKRLADSFDRLNKKEENEFPYLLIGRRDPRTCNSWMHNSYRLVKGKPACIAHINHADAAKLNVESGEQITITSRVGEIKIPVEVTENMMEGVVSVPHGWGHGETHTQMSIANTHAGSSVNQLTDEKFVDQLTGNAALNGVPIQVAAV